MSKKARKICMTITIDEGIREKLRGLSDNINVSKICSDALIAEVFRLEESIRMREQAEIQELNAIQEKKKNDILAAIASKLQGEMPYDSKSFVRGRDAGRSMENCFPVNHIDFITSYNTDEPENAIEFVKNIYHEIENTAEWESVCYADDFDQDEFAVGWIVGIKQVVAEAMIKAGIKEIKKVATTKKEWVQPDFL